jgi:signal transduction histidine kinase
VILLVAIAVILPTVCLLWFMTQAVKNVQLAARQRLIDVYQQDLRDASRKANEIWQDNLKSIDKKIADRGAFGTLSDLMKMDYDGAIAYAKTGERIYPVLSADVNDWVDPAENFRDAWHLEFAKRDYGGAIEVYEQKAQSKKLRIELGALIGKSRCLAKLGQSESAISTWRKVAFGPRQKNCDVPTLMLVANARLFLLELLIQNAEESKPLVWESFVKLLEVIHEENEVGSFIPSDQRAFLARKIVQIYKKSPLLKTQPRALHEEGMNRLIAGEELSIQLAERFTTAKSLKDWPSDQLRRIKDRGRTIYGMRHDMAEKIILLFLGQENAARALWHYGESLKDPDVAYCILDDSGGFVAGTGQYESKPFTTAPVGEYFPGWQIAVYFKDSDVFEKAASRQIAVYVWAGALVIVLIVAAGGFAGRAVGRQIKLNRLKNDFIATVSHELKTPLASMRVLVDTLLEGRYKGQQQATEYLQLVSQENERLSNLIDNFLTFSRMERNKQAFEMLATSPATIANRAAEAVSTKFEQGQCTFDISIDNDLPDVSADQDAMVTALVNLLDNAYKYSYDDKQIKLSVFTEVDSVCFRVADNGVGMSRRAVKRIFDRFYQADRSLTRRAEGCGLGLSIVKFIVDAHKGTIAVDSKPDRGSVFTIKMPAAG